MDFCWIKLTRLILLIYNIGNWQSFLYCYSQPLTTTLRPGLSSVQSPLSTSLPSNGTLHITVGVMFPKNESSAAPFSRSASAVAIAIDRIYREKLLPPGVNISFSFVWRFEECVESTSVGYAFQLINEQKVDVLIAPPCIDGAILAAHVGTFYNVPVMIWGPCFDSSFTHPDLFPTVM
ncbi:receptor family ligand binding region domain-containing protein [Ditylenchus destructor]|uniref:Receptor family ligand binding region domain-containing protein n=1 Tax=Ditylenchus destructor TaxID=166010 RepID=A0AAD4MK17_9BILA|nr:receptor family ligand binding region domain-containing protein [Ditylenchus destructor]